MLVNAKLKDEGISIVIFLSVLLLMVACSVAIQGIGIANLSVRLEKQKRSYGELKETLREINITVRVYRFTLLHKV
jgi:hypothetical protein